jgi:hypothetical protein
MTNTEAGLLDDIIANPTADAAHAALSVALLKLSKHYSLERNRHDQTRMG